MISFLLLTLLFIVSYLGFWQGRGTEKYYQSKPIYISHRGVTKNNPENTIEAFKEAESLGFQGIEVDIIASKDGVLYCSHNHHLNQETNHSGYIDQMLSDELDNMEFLSSNLVLRSFNSALYSCISFLNSLSLLS